MNVLFVYSLYEIESVSKPLRSQEQIQFGISYISAVLKKYGHKTKLAVLSRTSGVKKNRKIIHDYIEKFQPKLICFTAVSSEYEFIVGISRYLKSCYKDIYFLIGGVHVTLNPEAVLGDSFDALCIGEGEYPTLELVRHLEKDKAPSGIENLWIKNGDNIEKNSVRPFLENLDDLPFLDRGMWQEWIDERHDSQHSVLLGRGCPFVCTYCSNHALRKISLGQYVRLRGTDKIIEELKIIADRFPNNQNIYLEIETFNVDKQWTLELCKKLEILNEMLSKPLKFGVNLRITPNSNYDELFSACKKSNFRFINIGLESGSERIRRDILKRNYTNSDVINTVESAKKHNLQIALYNLIGIPGETMADFKETIKINRICHPDWTMFTIFFPYPGTDLYSLCKSNGYIDNSVDTEMERSKAILNIPNFSRVQIQKAYEWFYYDVYKDYKPLYILLIRVFVNKLRKWPKLFRIYLSFIRWNVYKNIKTSFRKNSFGKTNKSLIKATKSFALIK